MIDDRPDLPLLLRRLATTWHKGVVGLVASRLTERFRRPSCVIAWDDDGAAATGTGSLRSVPGVDIGRRGARGGRRRASRQGRRPRHGGRSDGDARQARRRWRRSCTTSSPPASARRARATALDIDGALTPGGVTDELLDLIDRVGPYGQGNPQPRFAFPAHRVKFAKIVGENHVRCVLQAADGTKLEGIAFRAAGQPLGDLLLNAGGMPLHVAGTVQARYLGRARPHRAARSRMRPIRAARAEVSAPAVSAGAPRCAAVFGHPSLACAGGRNAPIRVALPVPSSIG